MAVDTIVQEVWIRGDGIRTEWTPELIFSDISDIVDVKLFIDGKSVSDDEYQCYGNGSIVVIEPPIPKDKVAFMFIEARERRMN